MHTKNAMRCWKGTKLGRALSERKREQHAEFDASGALLRLTATAASISLNSGLLLGLACRHRMARLTSGAGLASEKDRKSGLGSSAPSGA